METSRIKALLDSQGHSLSVEFYPLAGDPRNALLETFLQKLTAAGIPCLSDGSRGKNEQDRPAFSLGADGSFRHMYQALPEGPEWPPFFTLLEILATGQSGLEPETRTLLEQSVAPADIKVLVSGSCPFCPRMVALANRLAAFSPRIRTRVVDIGLFPDWATRYRVRAAPTTILNDEIFLTGVHPESALADWIGRLSSGAYLQQLYRNDLLEKRLGEAVSRIREHPEHLPAAARLLEAEEFGVKLGAMALFEEIIDADPGLHRQVLEALAPSLIDSPDQVTGDAAFLIGRLAHPGKRAVLMGLLDHPNSEIAEIAREGLETGKQGE